MENETKIQTKGSDKRQETLATIQRWLTRFAALYNHVPSTVITGLWFDRLNLLSVSQLNATFRRLEETFKPTSACPFPTPAHILELVKVAEEADSKRQAERAWDSAIENISRYYTPDLELGGLARVHFSDKMWHCIRAAGGAEMLATCRATDLHFRKTEFLNAWENYSILEQDANFLPDSEAKKLFSQLVKEAKKLS